MFITLQFPLFDSRYLQQQPNRVERPKWPVPAEEEQVRYIGEIFNRSIPYLGPWDDEKKYCNAKSVINFCGTGNEHFYKMLFKSPAASRILFRRFQADGKCLAKFETGINDTFEDTVAGSDAATTAGAFTTHIKKILECPVRIKTGRKLSPFIPLANAGADLKHAYYWATIKGKKSFNVKEENYTVEQGEPVLLVQVYKNNLDISALPLQKVEEPSLQNTGMDLYCGYIAYQWENKHYNIKTWLVAVQDYDAANAIQPYNFQSYNNTLRYLRINLLRIHAEIMLQKKLLDNFGDSTNGFAVKDAAARDRLYYYLHKITLNLSSIKRNKQPQEKLVQTAFELDEKYYASAGIDQQLALLEDYKIWLKGLAVNDDNKQVIDYVDNSTTSLQQKKQDAASVNTVFISYNHADAATASLLKKKLESEKIKVILDSDAMLAGTTIDDFITSSIKNSGTTISIVSTNSLLSGWVSIESVNTIFFKKFFPQKKLIPCYIDTGFFDNKFILTATDTIDKKITDLTDLYNEQVKRNIATANLDDEKMRLDFLRNNLPAIIAHFKANLGVDISGNNLDANFPAILTAVTAS